MSTSATTTRLVRTGVLDVAVERTGSADGWPVVLLHGFPYDVRSYDAVVPRLTQAGADVVVPFLRGYGPTRFRSPTAMRTGQQAALAHDLLDLLDALDLDRPLLAGFDWGGRAACLVSLLWPERVGGLLSMGGYNVQDIAGASEPQPVEAERRLWYQYYLHGERGRRGLEQHRRELAGWLWREWSPTWDFTEDDLGASAGSFDNPDFVDVVTHSYRHRYGIVAGDPAYDETERRIAELDPITVPTIVLEGRHDTVTPPSGREALEPRFTRLLDHRLLDAGHAAPHERPDDVADALLELRRGIR